MSAQNVSFDQNNSPTQESSQVEGWSFEPIQVPFTNPVENDDDVIESSPRSFYQARANARRNRRRTATSLNFGNQTEVPFLPHNGDISTNLEASATVELQHANNLPETNQDVLEPVIEDIEPPREVRCPICLDSFVEETATKCGHIFCEGCIRAAIRRRAKCPTCRKKITSRGLRRVFLPS